MKTILSAFVTLAILAGVAPTSAQTARSSQPTPLRPDVQNLRCPGREFTEAVPQGIAGCSCRGRSAIALSHPPRLAL